MVEGFYEWQTTNKTAKTKQPYYIYAEQNDGLLVSYSSLETVTSVAIDTYTTLAESREPQNIIQSKAKCEWTYRA